MNWKRPLQQLTLSLLISGHLQAAPLSPSESVIGKLQVVKASPTETLIDLARRYGLGYDQVIKANPTVNRWVPHDGAEVLLPDRYVLPNAPREGIVLNLAELRLYYYLPSGGPDSVLTFPVSIGRMDWKTPLGRARVVRKEKNPPWRPPASIRREHAAEGEILPSVVPGGDPNNPLGHYALYLSVPGYLIHGVDERKAFGIGMRVTHGCVRMYPEHIELLYRMVPQGTPVFIVNEPIKVGWSKDELYLQVTTPLDEDGEPGARPTAEDALEVIQKAVTGEISIYRDRVEDAVKKGDGIPVVIGRRVPVYELQ